MEAKDYLAYIVNEIHTTIVATVDDEGLPVTAAIDMMDSDENGLYFLTAKGKGFYDRLIKRGFLALTAIKGQDTMSSVAVSVRGKVKELDMNRDSYGFTYSNFGYAVLGLVLEAVYDTDYTALLNNWVREELGMSGTKISERDGDLGHYWDWQPDDAYLSAGAITSNIDDMLRYAQMQLDADAPFALCHQSLKVINASTESYQTMGIYLDEIGMGWIIDKKNGIIWHNGGTGHYNSYLGFSPETGTAVVVLSNLSPNDRIPATVLGVKRLLELRR